MRQLIGFYKNILIGKEKRNLYLIFILGIIASVIDSLSIGIIPIYLLSITDTESFLRFAPDFLKNFIIIGFPALNKKFNFLKKITWILL